MPHNTRSYRVVVQWTNKLVLLHYDTKHKVHNHLVSHIVMARESGSNKHALALAPLESQECECV
jgi:hypothetical protein